MQDPASVHDLDTYIRGVEEAVSRGLGQEETSTVVSELNHALMASGFRMPDEFRAPDPSAAYTRNLVHLDSRKRFAVISLVWGPFQETAVHDHLNWCVMSMLEGKCVSLDYDRLDDESNPHLAELAVRAASVLETGTVVRLTPPPSKNIHRISNGTRMPAITMHTYGNPGTKARMFDLTTGRVEIEELVFHNR